VKTDPVKLLHRLFNLALLCWLAGCGPGVGGSGTGENAQALADFGATAAPVCAASFASKLKCAPATPASPGSAGMPTPSADGTALAVFVDGGARVSATLQDNSIELEARCERLRFSGQWGVDGAGQARYYGYLVDEASGLRRLATLSVAPVPGGLQVLLQASDGTDLLGPVDLLAQSAAPAPVPSCP
jgi:hypothetical protein